MKKALCYKCEWILAQVDDGIISIRNNDQYIYIEGKCRIICKGCGSDNHIESNPSDEKKNEDGKHYAILSEWTRRKAEKRYQKEMK